MTDAFGAHPQQHTYDHPPLSPYSCPRAIVNRHTCVANSSGSGNPTSDAPSASVAVSSAVTPGSEMQLAVTRFQVPLRDPNCDSEGAEAPAWFERVLPPQVVHDSFVSHLSAYGLGPSAGLGLDATRHSFSLSKLTAAGKELSGHVTRFRNGACLSDVVRIVADLDELERRRQRMARRTPHLYKALSEAFACLRTAIPAELVGVIVAFANGALDERIFLFGGYTVVEKLAAGSLPSSLQWVTANEEPQSLMCLDSSVCFDAAALQFEVIPSMAVRRAGASAALLADGRIRVCGTTTVYSPPPPLHLPPASRTPTSRLFPSPRPVRKDLCAAETDMVAIGRCQAVGTVRMFISAWRCLIRAQTHGRLGRP